VNDETFGQRLIAGFLARDLRIAELERDEALLTAFAIADDALEVWRHKPPPKVQAAYNEYRREGRQLEADKAAARAALDWITQS
jgi:hypothetical protein